MFFIGSVSTGIEQVVLAYLVDILYLHFGHINCN